MVINMVIVDNDLDRGSRTGEMFAAALAAAEQKPWRMSVHVRTNLNKTTDDRFERYSGC